MTITAIFLNIPGKPIPLKRPRAKYFSNKMWVYNSQLDEMTNTKLIMKSQYRAPPVNEALCVSYLFEMPLSSWKSPKNHKRELNNTMHPINRPDVSNIIKYYEDCMNGVIYSDDSIIIRTSALKIYSKNPRTLIWIRSANLDEIESYKQQFYLYDKETA